MILRSKLLKITQHFSSNFKNTKFYLSALIEFKPTPNKFASHGHTQPDPPPVLLARHGRFKGCRVVIHPWRFDLG
jgi:hypothetical protein